MRYLLFIVALLLLSASASAQSMQQLPSRERIEVFDRGAQERWQFDRDLIQARRDAMVDREIVFVDELSGEIRRRFINNLVDQQFGMGRGGQRRLDFVVDDRRDLVLVRPIAQPASSASRSHVGPLRRILGCGSQQSEPTLGLVPVRPISSGG